MESITRPLLLRAFAELDSLLATPVELLIGGGSAMVAVYGDPGSTRDVDAVLMRSGLSFEELKPLLVSVAERLDLPKDWMNPYVSAYTHVLPADYAARLHWFFQGDRLRCAALGPEDLLIMKLVAGRKKDDPHVRRLMKREGIDLSLVERHLETLVERELPDAAEALDRFDEYRSDLEIG